MYAAVLLISALAVPASAGNHKTQAAQTQFARAEKLRARLNGRYAEERSRKDYQSVIDAYRRVYYLDPGSPKAAPSVLAVADLLAETGRQFDDRKALHAAIGQYKFLLREYPGYAHSGDAGLTIAHIYQDDRRDAALAKSAYQEFLKRYPHNRRAEDARKALAQVKPTSKPVQAETAKARVPTPNRDADLSRVTGIRYWSTSDTSRVAIDLDGDITFHSERLQQPDRVIFDLHWTRLAPSLTGKSFTPKDGLLKKINISEYGPSDARVVLEGENLAN